MSIRPAQNEDLELFEGSTFDETWTIRDADGEPLWTDPTDWSGKLQVRQEASESSAVILTLSKIAGVGDPPTTSGLVFSANGVVRVYITDEDLAALNASQFALVREEGEVSYQAKWDFETENPDGERVREMMGTVFFSPEVTR